MMGKSEHISKSKDYKYRRANSGWDKVFLSGLLKMCENQEKQNEAHPTLEYYSHERMFGVSTYDCSNS